MVLAPLLWSSSLAHIQSPLPRQHVAPHRSRIVPLSLRDPPPRRTLWDSRVTHAVNGPSEADQLRQPEAAPKPSEDDRLRSRANLWRYDRAAVERGGWLIDGTQRGMLEAQVGIRCWTDDLPGFSGILKQRCGPGGEQQLRNPNCSLQLLSA